MTNKAIASIKGINLIAGAMPNKKEPPVQNIQEVVITVPKPDVEIPWWIGGGGSSGYGSSQAGGMNGGSTTHGGGGGGGSSSQSASQWAKDHIDASALKNNKCADEVYQKLKDNSAFFNNLLGKFEGKSILNLNFDIKDIGTIVANVGVENVKNGYVTVTLNPNYLGSTELGRANVFIHEMLHAYMAWQLLNSGWNGEDNAQSYKSIDERNLPSLLKAFREKEYKSGASEHEFMTNYYIPKIVNALKAYDPNLGTDSEYEAIAWNGLQGTDSYSNLKKTNPDREATINSLIRDNIKKVPCGN